MNPEIVVCPLFVFVSVLLRKPWSAHGVALILLVFALAGVNKAQAIPTFQAAGVEAAGNGVVKPAWPAAHQINDIALLFIETSGTDAAVLTTPAGFVEVTNSPQVTVTLPATGTRITVFWARATSTAMTAPSIAPTQHTYARILTYRGVANTGNPWDITGGGVKAVASTAVTVTGVTTTVPDTLIVQAVARDTDSAAAAFSAQMNVALTGLAERSDAGTISSDGGGFAVWDGVKATAGATGDTTAIVTSSINAFLTIALKPMTSAVVSINRADADPTSAASVSWTITFNTSVTGVNSGNFTLANTGLGGTLAITSVTGGGTTWTVTASTGTGGGTLGLNMTNNTGISAAMTNLPFTGQVYTIDRTVPVVSSIVRVDPSPTALASVSWTVTFSESVTGVDATDFVLAWGGGAGGGAITSVTGSGAAWTVTASTGVSNGTLGLNLVDDDSIIDAAINQLGGAGAGNGSFTGEVYTLSFTAPSFVFTNSPCVHNIAFGAPGQCALVTWSPQIAGQNLTGIYITAVSAAGIPTRLHASQLKTIDMQFGLACHNPVTHAGKQAFFDGVPLPLCQPNGSTPAAWSAIVTITFNGGSPSSAAFYTFNYADVGMVELWMSNSATPAQVGNSSPFVVKPGGFVLSNIKCSTIDAANCGAGALAMATPGDNPAAADAAGVTFIRAGHPFTATVKATTLDGVTPTPNYGQETTPEGVRFVDTSLLPADPNYANHGTLAVGLGLTNNPAIRNIRKGSITALSTALTVVDSADFGVGNRILVAGAGVAGTILVTTVAAIPDATTITLASAASTTVAGTSAQHGFSGGTLTESDFVWDEVGIITLTPGVGDGDYLGAGDASGTQTGNIGRFYAAKFALSGGVIANRTDLAGCTVAGCGTFTYMGEQMNALFTLTAQAIDGTPLQNYNWSVTTANQFAKLNPMAAIAPGTGGPLGMGAVDSAATRTPFIPCGVAPAHPCLTPAQATAGTFALGVANVTVPLTIYRGNAAVGPYALLDIGVAPVDSDGAALIYNRDTENVVAGTPNHTLVGQTQARYGRMKLSNAHGSELLPLAINVAAQYWNGTTYVTNILDYNSSFPAIFGVMDVSDSNYLKNLNSGETGVITPPASVAFNAGVCSYRLSAPGVGNNGSVDMTVNALSAYLPSGNTARATFGVYKGNNEFIYLREAY